MKNEIFWTRSEILFLLRPRPTGAYFWILIDTIRGTHWKRYKFVSSKSYATRTICLPMYSSYGVGCSFINFCLAPLPWRWDTPVEQWWSVCCLYAVLRRKIRLLISAYYLPRCTFGRAIQFVHRIRVKNDFG